MLQLVGLPVGIVAIERLIRSIQGWPTRSSRRTPQVIERFAPGSSKAGTERRDMLRQR